MKLARRRVYSLVAIVGSMVAGPTFGQETGSARLVVAPQQIAVATDELTWTELSLSHDGDGDLVWTARVDAPWLKLAVAQDRTPLDSLAGEGEAILQVCTIGRGLPKGTHEGRVLIDGSGGVTVPVTMTVLREPALGPSETRVDLASVPSEAWSTPFAVPVAQVLTHTVDEVADRLQQQSGLDLRDVRVVAVTSQRVLYVAAEDEYQDQASGLTRRQTRVWTSADGGATWSPLLRAPPYGDCYYSTRLQSAALHPDGERVFLGVNDGLFLDGGKVHGPAGLTNIDALHVSADGYLYVATEGLHTACGASPYPSSDDAVYQGRIIAGRTRPEWDGGRSTLVGFLAPVDGIGSDPMNRDVVYLRAASGAVFRKVMGPGAYGWQHVDAASLPEEISFVAPSLAPATDYVRVPHSYAQEYVPFGIDSHNAWGGFLIGGEGLAYGYYRGHHGGMYWNSVMGSRDGGVTWFNVWGHSKYGTRPTGFHFLDARGFVGVNGGSGRWALDPIDPLTSFVAGGGSAGSVSRSVSGGGSWASVGARLPDARGTPRIALDSLGTLYARFGDDVYTRSIADHPLRVAKVRMEPEVLRRGDRAVVTARVVPWPRGSAPPFQLPDEVRLQTEPDLSWMDLRDDGMPPDATAGDGLWTVEITVPDDRPYGFYGAIVAARTVAPPGRGPALAPATRWSRPTI